MMIQLTPEDEELIQKRLESGVFRTAGEVIHDALAMQKAEADWLAQNQEAINDKIAQGIRELDRGQGVDGAEARTRLDRRKADWIDGQSRR
jgi:antitoxin ParD1/3/4